MQRLKRVAPQVRAKIVRGAGHDFTVAEADAVDRKIIEFLRPTSVRIAAAG